MHTQSQASPNTQRIIRTCIALLALCCSAFLVACGPMPNDAIPCESQADCMANEGCTAGLCQPLQASPQKPGTPGQTTPQQPGQPQDPASPKQPQAPTNPKQPTDPTAPKEPQAPACPGKAPTCLAKGVCRVTKPTCEDGEWRCTYPDAYKKEERLCDGKDNDCDGDVDETCHCTPGTTQECGDAVGACSKGTQTCQQDGTWGRCESTTEPTEETCDNVDNDCDGQVDENIERSCTRGRKDSQGVGECKGGRQVCKAGQWGECIGEVFPQEEICDGKDNDCDGQTDENLQKSCYSGPAGTMGQGPCKGGVSICQEGQWSPCDGEVTPQTERCDGQDNDCDGQTDEDFSALGQSCTAGVGACQSSGAWRCAADGSGIVCSATPKAPSMEICDGVDNDCDGQTDERLTRTCYSGPAGTNNVGPCRNGTQTCQAGQWSRCTGDVTPQPETCDNVDNDCDGLIDEQLQKACYSGPAGTDGRGTCRGGVSTCSVGRWSQCVGQVTPQPERCDGKDNDCDGQIDETWYQLGQGCSVGTGACQNRGVFQCKSDGSGVACSATPKAPSMEVCDGVDNDCDGQTDEGSSICGTGKICQQGQCLCDQSKGYYRSGNLCLKEGDTCPAGLAQRPFCATSSHWVMCDPYGKVGVLHCPSFTGKQSINVLGVAGCQAIPSQHNTSSCMSFSTNYGAKRSWQAVMKGFGPHANHAVVIFDHCVGSGRNACGTIVTSSGSQTSCLCGERSTYCSNLRGTVYDVSYSTSNGQCMPFWGNQFGCPEPLNGKNACMKSTTNGFATYTCGF